MILYRPPLDRLERRLAAKRANLARPEAAYRAAGNDKSRASYRGKITRCQKDIAGLEAQIKRLYA